ncbi:securin [Sphaeramia orbicularis]|uniref:Securin n=1 Tax=Sphaeramia orbicularis TaxID=375764 RepID=A0A673CJC9_9TELE|nr:securin-like [Sphaeramia orbicularis]XP_030002071.1 securin-like [Sphaeramia orbicularis]
MANIIFAEQENARLHAPSLKMRQRLQSAPEQLKTPSTAKTFVTPQLSSRKALGTVNKMVSTPAINVQEKKLLKPEGTKVKPQKKVQEYPEIEKFFPYDPLEFDKYSVPEDLVPLSKLALPGLACFPQASHLHLEEPEILSPLPNMSPVKMPKCSDHCSELDAFLQTLNELTVELPPESVTD